MVDARLHQLDRRVDPLARLLVRVALRVRALTDHERAVVARLVADERVDDVEEGLVAGPDDPVAEHVRVRAAALARHRVDVVDVLRPEIEQDLGDFRDELALADARLEALGDVLVGPVDHRAGRVEQDDLVDGLDLARVEHDLLPVTHHDPLVGQGSRHRRLDEVDTERHVGDALGAQDFGNLAGRAAEQAGVGGDRPAQPDHPGMHVLLRQPRAVQAVVPGRRAEVPDVRVATAGQERVARHLVARPLADVGARRVADVVEVEQQDRAQVGSGERRPRAAEPVRPHPLDVPALLPVDVQRPG